MKILVACEESQAVTDECGSITEIVTGDDCDE